MRPMAEGIRAQAGPTWRSLILAGTLACLLPWTAAHAFASSPRESAWLKAVQLAGVREEALAVPEIFIGELCFECTGGVVAQYVPFANEIHIYQLGCVSVFHLLVHEFLHAIYYQLPPDSITLVQLAQEDPSEVWVRERMGKDQLKLGSEHRVPPCPNASQRAGEARVKVFFMPSPVAARGLDVQHAQPTWRAVTRPPGRREQRRPPPPPTAERTPPAPP